MVRREENGEVRTMAKPRQLMIIVHGCGEFVRRRYVVVHDASADAVDCFEGEGRDVQYDTIVASENEDSTIGRHETGENLGVPGITWDSDDYILLYPFLLILELPFDRWKVGTL